MQVQGSSQVSPQIALDNESAWAMAHASGAGAVVCFAGVAQLVEHLFCKQVVAGSSPTASSAVGPRVMASGSHARGFRVLASFGLRSDAHALKCVPLRSSPKPRQNAELRARVIGARPLGTAAAVRLAVLSPRRSASSLARSASATVREPSESCPSGQREQAVNLPDLSYAGSNPALSTSAARGAASVSISCLGELSSPSAEVNSAEPPPQVLGPQPQNTAGVSFTEPSGLESRGTKRSGSCFTELGRGRSRAMTSFAGVAQLVERQPSKLNVEGSSPFSRSKFSGSVSHHESKPAQTPGHTRVGSLVAGEAEPRTGAERTPVREHRSVSRGSAPAPAEVNSAGPHPRFWGPRPKTFVFGSVSHHESKPAQTYGQARVASLVAVEAEASIGAERTPVREHRSAAEAKTPTKIATRRVSSQQRHCHAHLAQMVEHVLGKDEVTSSILVVGSKP